MEIIAILGQAATKWVTFADYLIEILKTEWWKGLAAIPATLFIPKIRDTVKRGILFLWNKTRFYAQAEKRIADIVNRMNTIEKNQTAIQDNVRDIGFHFKENGGKSMIDKINQLLTISVRSNARIKNIESNLAVGTFFSDENGFLIEVNDFFCDLAQREREELLQKNWLNCVAKNEVDRIEKAWMNAIFSVRNFEDSFFIHPINDDPFKVKMCARPVMNGATLSGYSGTIRQISY